MTDTADPLLTARWITIRPNPDEDKHPLHGARWIGPSEKCEPDAGRFLATVVDFTLPQGRAISSATFHFWVEGRMYFDPTFATPIMAEDEVNWAFCRVNGSCETHFRELVPLLDLRAVHSVSIGHLLIPGENRIAFLSWMTLPEPGVIAVVEITFEDGETLRIASDASWSSQVLSLAEARAADWHEHLDALTGCRELCAFAAEPWSDIRALLNHLPSPVVLRRSFKLPQRPIASAHIEATAIGMYDMELNGQRVGDVYFAPGWTDIRKTAHVQRYDVTSLVRPGDNRWCSTVAKGYAGSPMQGCVPMREDTKALRAALVVRYHDGETLRIVTEAEGWEGGDGPVRDSEIYNGETVDRTYTPISRPVIELPERATRCIPETAPQPKVVREFVPLSITARGRGTFIVDFGQNFSGFVRLHLDEPTGTRVVLRHAEALRNDGALMTANLGRAACTDSVVCDGQPFVFEPRFTMRGFRYVEVSGLSRDLTAEDIRGIAISSVTRETFTGTSSFPQINSLIEMIRWTQLSNWLVVPSDCPQRSERLGWMGDNQLFAPSGLLLYDGKDFQHKHLDDIYDGANANGSPPEFAPCGGGAGPRPSYAYAEATVTLPHAIWKIYGDLSVAREHWRDIAAYLQAMDRAADEEGLITYGTYGDWLTIEAKAPHAIMGPIQQANTYLLAAELAEALGDTEAACHYNRRFEEIATVWRRRHLHADGTIEHDTQSVYLCAWKAGMIPAECKPGVTRAMRASFARWDDHLRTGIISTAALLDVLVDAGLLDVAWKILSDDSFPSYGYFVKNGATTMPEWWDPWPGEHETTEYWANFKGDRSQNEFHGSLNHPVFGSIFGGIFRHVWGLRQAPRSSGFREVIIQPRFTDKIESFSGKFDSVSGTYALSWQRKGNGVHYEITIPEGGKATLIPPDGECAPLHLATGTTRVVLPVARC